jgi:AraC-like DNA-binding protein
MRKEIIEQLSVITDEEKRILSGNNVDFGIYGETMMSEDNVIDGRKLIEPSKSITIRPHTRFTEFPRHRHNYIEMMYMCQGKTKHKINTEDNVVLNAGEILILGRNAFHSIEKAEKDDIAINFIILPEFFGRALEMIGTDNTLGRFILSSLINEKIDTNYLLYKVSDIVPVQNLIENLAFSILNHESNIKKRQETTLGLLFLELLNCTDYLSQPEKDQWSNETINKLFKEIQDNYVSITLTGISEKYGLTEAYLSRLIHKTTGETFKDILQGKRLSIAAAYLKTTDMTVSDIIQEVGYENSSYFYRLFSTKYGMTPYEYRKSKNIN